MDEEAIRRDERQQLATVLEANSSVLVAYSKDRTGLLGLVCLLLRLEEVRFPNLETAANRDINSDSRNDG